MNPVALTFSFFSDVFTSSFVNEFGIDFSWLLHQFLEGVSPNVPSLFRDLFGGEFLTEFHVVFLSFFFGEPSATRIFLKNSYFHEKQFRKILKFSSVFASLFFDVHDFFSIDFRIDLFIDF